MTIAIEMGNTTAGAPASLDLEELLATRLLVQGNSGSGKSHLLRRLLEQSAPWVQQTIIDPEGDFVSLAERFGHLVIDAEDHTERGLQAAGERAREHRVSTVLNLEGLDAENQMRRAAAFLNGLFDAPRDHWYPMLVIVDEAQLFAPAVAGEVSDDARKLSLGAMTNLMCRGRKRGLAGIIATQRLAKLASSVVSELHNHLIGLNIFDRDVARAADLLGFGSDQAALLRQLPPGEFFAFGPALTPAPVLAKIDPTITPHIGRTPDLVAAADLDPAQSRSLLDLEALREMSAAKPGQVALRGVRALDAFLLDPAAPSAARIVAALGNIAPNATTADDLSRHLALPTNDVDAGLDLLAAIGASDTMPRGDTRIARLSARLRLRVVDTPVVGLA